MKMRRVLIVVLLIGVVFLLAGCIPGDGSYEARPANFLSGIWHGWIAPVSLIIGIFNHGIRVYEPINTGWWYDFGFYIAVISGFGGVALTRRARHRWSNGHREDRE
jgi:hypothetical protein